MGSTATPTSLLVTPQTVEYVCRGANVPPPPIEEADDEGDFE